MCTDAVTQLHVRIQVRHEEHTTIEALLLNHPQPSVQRTQKDERRFVSDMSPPILTRGVVPLSVQQLEGATDFIVPIFRNVASLEVHEIHEIDIA